MAARAWWLSAVLLTAGLAGCASDAPGVAPPTGDGDAANGTPPGAVDGSGPPPREDAERGVAHTPVWTVGQWWRMQVEHRFADTFELTVVVAAVSDTSYEVGFDDLDAGLAALPIHLPPVGTHTRPELGFWWHGETASFLSFPLEDGKRWTAPFRGEPLEYTAELDPDPGHTPRFVVTGRTADGVAMVRGLYDAAWGHFTDLAWGFDVEAGDVVTTMSMLAGGTGHTGDVYVPSMSDAYVGQATGPNPGVPGLPSATPPGSFDVPASSSALVLAGFLGGGPGTYEIAWQGPEGGPQLFTQNNPPGEDTVALAVAVVDEAHAGAWHVGLNAGGPGFVLAEAIAVTVAVVALP